MPLVHMLGEAEFDIKKEAAWAISNATSGGRHDQIKYLVNAGAIKPLCDLLTCSDPRIVTVALEGIENILKACPPGPRPPSSRHASATSTAATSSHLAMSCICCGACSPRRSHRLCPDRNMVQPISLLMKHVHGPTCVGIVLAQTCSHRFKDLLVRACTGEDVSAPGASV